MTSVISALQDRLKNYPLMTVRLRPGYLEIPAQAADGFKVWVQESPGAATVGFEGWHEEFRDPESALNCVAMGLSSACRLRVFRLLGLDFKWQLLVPAADGWVVESETALLLPTFWLPSRQRELQNRTLPGPMET